MLITIAVLVLALAGSAVTRLARSARHGPAGTRAERPHPVAPAASEAPATDAVVLMAVVGEAMLDSGYDVDSVRSAVEDVAAVNG